MKKIIAAEYARLQARATELMGCCEGSADEQELVKTVELIEHLEAGTACRETALRPPGGSTMAVNKPTGDNARKGAVRKRSQLKTPLQGEDTWTKRDKTTGEFMDQKKTPAEKPYKGVRKEK